MTKSPVFHHAAAVASLGPGAAQGGSDEGTRDGGDRFEQYLSTLSHLAYGGAGGLAAERAAVVRLEASVPAAQEVADAVGQVVPGEGEGGPAQDPVLDGGEVDDELCEGLLSSGGSLLEEDATAPNDLAVRRAESGASPATRRYTSFQNPLSMDPSPASPPFGVNFKRSSAPLPS